MVALPTNFRMFVQNVQQLRKLNPTYVSFRRGSVMNAPPVIQDALLWQLFVQSLEGAAFTLYVNLLEGSTVSWQSMELEFLK